MEAVKVGLSMMKKKKIKFSQHIHFRPMSTRSDSLCGSRLFTAFCMLRCYTHVIQNCVENLRLKKKKHSIAKYILHLDGCAVVANCCSITAYIFHSNAQLQQLDIFLSKSKSFRNSLQFFSSLLHIFNVHCEIHCYNFWIS